MSKTYNYCRLCNSTDLKLFLEVQKTAGNISRMLKKEELGLVKATDLKVYKCCQCGFTQLNKTLADDFYDEYLMGTSFSPQMDDYQMSQASNFINRYHLQGKSIIEVGCGDGGYLEKLNQAGAKAVGIEPSKKFRDEALKKNLKVYLGYVSKQNPIPNGEYDAFVTRQVLEHVPEIHDFLQGIKKSIKKDSIGLIEVPSLEKAIKDKRFYDFFPDHLNYYSKQTLKLALEMNQFEVIEIVHGMHDEYNIAYVKNIDSNEVFNMQESMLDIITQINNLITKEKQFNRKIAIWGAGGKGISTMAAANVEGVSYVIDTDPHKQGLFTPVLHLPIHSPEILNIQPVDTILITALAYTNEILDQLNQINFKGDIFLLNENIIHLKKH